MTHTKKHRNLFKRALLSATLLGAFSGLAHAQDASTDKKPAEKAKTDDVIVVTGYRASLQSATRAKKNSTDFSETIFSEDMGKFPDVNLAESMQRVPGMIVARDPLTGDGTQITIRALPANFTQVTMNGNRVNVASDFGFTGSSSPNRNVDLDMFPSELFNRVDVKKTPSADALEGGIAGTVNIQNARPFDHKGQHVVFSVNDSYNENARTSSPRVTGLYSNTWDKFGILVGFTSSQKKILSDGFETVGWTDPNLSAVCGSQSSGGCEPSGPVTGTSNGFKFANTVSTYAGNGLVAGTPLNTANLLAMNPGLTSQQLAGAIMPRLGRDYLLDGTAKNNVGLVSMEFRPTDNMKFTLDILGGLAKRNAVRTDMMWTVRSTGPNDGYNNGMIPMNMTVNANDVVTSGTFADSNFLSESNNYVDKTGMGSVNLGGEWKISDTLKWDAEISDMHSTYERDVTFLKFDTPVGANITVNYQDSSTANNAIPTITPSVNLANPNLGWKVFQILLQRDRRFTDSDSFHTNLTKDLGEWTLKAGYAYDYDHRTINVTDNSGAYSTEFNSVISTAQLPQYLTAINVPHYMAGVTGAGFTNFIVPNFGAIFAATNYGNYINASGNVTTGTTYNGAGAGDITEKIGGAYLQALNKTTLWNIPIKSNFGVRFVNTDQQVTSPSSVNGQILYITTEHKYSDVLPSFNAVAALDDNFNLRVAASKSMTRANPSSMNSQLGFSDPGGQNASEGNPNLKPYYSDNYDIGGEYYTGGIGYVGLTYFAKVIQNYTYNQTVVEPFSALGIPFSSITTQQQTAINVNGGPATAMVNLSEPVNSTAEQLHIGGQEFMWVQPLDFLTKGLGYTFNYTHFNFSDVKIQAGIPNYTYNLTAFYERGNFSAHISYVDVGTMTIGVSPSANSIYYNEYQAERHQIDASLSYKFKAFGMNQSFNLDAVNLDSQGFRAYEGFKNITYQYNNPGMSLYAGWRTQF